MYNIYSNNAYQNTELYEVYAAFAANEDASKTVIILQKMNTQKVNA